jgi:hypothetical protein
VKGLCVKNMNLWRTKILSLFPFTTYKEIIIFSCWISWREGTFILIMKHDMISNNISTHIPFFELPTHHGEKNMKNKPSSPIIHLHCGTMKPSRLTSILPLDNVVLYFFHCKRHIVSFVIKKCQIKTLKKCKW